MELAGEDAVKFLNGPDTIRDGMLVALAVWHANTDPVIELTFMKENSGRVVILELWGVQEFDFAWSKEHFHVIEMVKCLLTDAGEFYLSLDPYDEREQFVSENDNDCFRSKFVKLTTA
jgi:hypothetical protein